MYDCKVLGIVSCTKKKTRLDCTGAKSQETMGEKYGANNAILSEEAFMLRMLPVL